MSPLVTAWFFLTFITFISMGFFLLALRPTSDDPTPVHLSGRRRALGLIMLLSSLLGILSALGVIVFGT
jgi:hypothetical protein